MHHTQVAGIKVIANVTAEVNPNPARVIALQKQLIVAARAQFDVVILDTAPLLGANDAIEVTGEADFAVLVARAGVSTIPGAHRAIEMLNRVDAPLVGSILVGADPGSNPYYSYSGDLSTSPASSPASKRGRRGRRSQRDS